METFIKKFSDIAINDIPRVGGKNASLGEMFNSLASKGIRIPDGFAVTVAAYKYFINYNKLEPELKRLITDLDTENFSNLSIVGNKARNSILNGTIPEDLKQSIVNAYKDISIKNLHEVAVRSSATAEDLATASFAGQHDSYLNVSSPEGLLESVKRCFASLYNDRAIKYREDQGFGHDKVFLSVGVQLMVRSDLACSGIGFTLEPESGFRDVVHLAATYGLGENIVQGIITPDEYLLFKPSLKN
jgi:pyruvate, water dikinase